MIKSIFSKLAQGILIVALVCAGSFVYVEESAEKTEKTEKSEEALHRSDHSNTAKRLVRLGKKEKNYSPTVSICLVPFVEREIISDFNVNYIYTTSYLDSSI